MYQVYLLFISHPSCERGSVSTPVRGLMAASSSVPGASDALKRFELENDVREIDSIFRFSNEDYQRSLQGKPWKDDPRYFKHVRISALALVKMVMHSRGGGAMEIMGLMQGKIDLNDPRGPAFVILDTFALPVEGTETRVNAQADAYEYMADFQSLAKEGSRLENVVGWYHSHPGYGCWLSGIDCSTQERTNPRPASPCPTVEIRMRRAPCPPQMLNQQYQEPWLALVIDPTRTAATGKVEIGAFRTYPQVTGACVCMSEGALEACGSVCVERCDSGVGLVTVGRGWG